MLIIQYPKKVYWFVTLPLENNLDLFIFSFLAIITVELIIDIQFIDFSSKLKIIEGLLLC
jgi:hypothetical protein